MKNKRDNSFIPFAIVTVFWFLAVSACVSSDPVHTASPTMAVLISAPDAPPSTAQLAVINRLLMEQIAARGFTVAKNGVVADYIMRVRFMPDTVHAQGGHLTLLGIERNQNALGSNQDNLAAEDAGRALSELRRVISETEWTNAISK